MIVAYLYAIVTLVYTMRMFKKERVYLDSAAGTTGNPSSPHAEGRAAREMLETARTDIARMLEVQADDVLFTSGATESNALAILGTVRATTREGEKHVLYLPSAHASLVGNAKRLEEEGAIVEPLQIRDGRVDTDALATQLRSETVLVTMDAVCGETGTVWNTREVAEVLRAKRISFFTAPVLHVDASQTPWTENMTRAHFGADLLTFDGAKVGPRGIGLLVAHRTMPIRSLYEGGGQERGVRPGSEAPELAREMAAALRAAATGRTAFAKTASAARASLLDTLSAALGAVVVNAGETTVPNIVNLSFPGLDTDYLVTLLDTAGYAVSTKSACETDSTEGSRAVCLLTGDRDRAKATVRVSWSPATRERDLARFASALVQSVLFLRGIDTPARR